MNDRHDSPEPSLRRIIDGYVSFKNTVEGSRDLLPSKLFVVLHPVVGEAFGFTFPYCSWILTEHGVGLAANQAINEFTVRIA